MDSETPHVPTKLERVKALSHRVKTTAHNMLHDDDHQIEDEDEEDDLFDDPAFNPDKMHQLNSDRRGSLRDRLHHGTRVVVNSVKNPRRAVTNSYTRKAASKVSSYASDRAAHVDEDLIDAHDVLTNLKMSRNTSTQDLTDFDLLAQKNSIDNAELRVDQIDEHRASLRAAWILSRHVKRAKVVTPMSTRPQKSDFMINKDAPHKPQVMWDEYMVQMAIWHTRNFTAAQIDDITKPPFDLIDLANTVERLAVVTTPWQLFLMDVRSVYLWESPQRTFWYLILYLILCYTHYMFAYCIGRVIYTVIMERYHPSSVEMVREKLKRAQTQTAKVRAWSELIQKHGKQDWLEPLLDEMGPLLQLQLSDTANFLEIIQNFAQWERPDKTLASLFYLAICFLAAVVLDISAFVTALTGYVGIIFFVGFPIATKWPRYRHLVTPLYWMFWDIPNTAELAVIQLQQKAIIKDRDRLTKAEYETSHDVLYLDKDTVWEYDSSDTSSPTPSIYVNAHQTLPPSTPTLPSTSILHSTLMHIQSTDALTFRAVLLPQYAHSRLTLTRKGFWLANKTTQNFHPYTSLIEIQKINLDNNADDNTSSAPRRSTAQIKKQIQRWSALQFVPTGLIFILKPPTYSRQPPQANTSNTGNENTTVEDRGIQDTRTRDELTLMVSEADRDKIFSVVLSWNNVKWLPLFSMDRQNKMGGSGEKGRGNRNIDDALKKAFKSL